MKRFDLRKGGNQIAVTWAQTSNKLVDQKQTTEKQKGIIEIIRAGETLLNIECISFY